MNEKRGKCSASKVHCLSSLASQWYSCLAALPWAGYNIIQDFPLILNLAFTYNIGILALPLHCAQTGVMLLLCFNKDRLVLGFCLKSWVLTFNQSINQSVLHFWKKDRFYFTQFNWLDFWLHITPSPTTCISDYAYDEVNIKIWNHDKKALRTISVKHLWLVSLRKAFIRQAGNYTVSTTLFINSLAHTLARYK